MWSWHLLLNFIYLDWIACSRDQSCEIGGKKCSCIVKTDRDCDNRLWNQRDREESLSVVKKWKYKWFRWKAIECFIILSLKVDSFEAKIWMSCGKLWGYNVTRVVKWDSEYLDAATFIPCNYLVIVVDKDKILQSRTLFQRVGSKRSKSWFEVVTFVILLAVSSLAGCSPMLCQSLQHIWQFEIWSYSRLFIRFYTNDTNDYVYHVYILLLFTPDIQLYIVDLSSWVVRRLSESWIWFSLLLLNFAYIRSKL